MTPLRSLAWSLAVSVCVLALPGAPAAAAHGYLDRTYGRGGYADGAPNGTFTLAQDAAPALNGSTIAAGGGFLGTILIRINGSGVVDRTFGSGGIARPRTSHVHHIDVADDGAVAVLGSTNSLLEDQAPYLQLNLLDHRGRVISTAMQLSVADVAAARQRDWPDPLGVGFQPDGKVIVGVRWWESGSSIQRYNRDGSVDPTFGLLGSGAVRPHADLLHTMRVQRDGSILAAGSNGEGIVIMRLLPTGAPDPTFGVGGRVEVPSEGPLDVLEVTMDDDGSVTTVASALHHSVIVTRHDRLGAPIRSFGRAGIARRSLARRGEITDIAVEAGGVVYVATRREDASWTREFVTRYGPRGIDRAFGARGVVDIPGTYGAQLVATPKGLVVVGHALRSLRLRH